MESDTTKVAFYKARPSCSIKYRPGPVQCARTCTSCIAKRAELGDLDTENILLLTSYDNLVQRKNLWFPKYQAIQYHVGQIEILKGCLDFKPEGRTSALPTLYVVAATRFSDINYLKMVLDYENLPEFSRFEGGPPDNSLKFLKFNQTFAVVLEIKSCPLGEQSGEGGQILHVLGIRDFIEPIVRYAKENSNFDVNLVPVIITKDHDKQLSFRNGSVCVQILEPYPLQEYLANTRTQYTTGHLVQHLYYDLARNAARMPANMVAFLLLYLDRDGGVTFDDFVDLMDWFKISAMDLGLQFAFTGETRDVVEFALITLQDFVHYNRASLAYIPINLAALAEYANLVIPNIAYQGIIARAILTLHNKEQANQLLTKLCPRVGPSDGPICVSKEELDLLGRDMAERIDNLIPCRRPCISVELLIDETIHQMETFYHYFKVEEPKVKQPKGPSWLNEFDTQYDDEYFASRQNDPAFKSWVVLSQRPYRLDRLNLFLNAVEPLLLN